VLLVSTDIRRPAAVLQLQRLATQVSADFFPVPRRQPRDIAAGALTARRGVYDVLIVDTAGRLHVDAELMAAGHRRGITPHERLFVWMRWRTGRGEFRARSAKHWR
jgi:signal recognition particle subunit SRP54